MTIVKDPKRVVVDRPTGSLQGWAPTWSNTAEKLAILAAAIDYRGDVTLVFRDRKPVIGYVFNFVETAQGEIEMYVKGEESPRRFSAEELVSVSFTGADTAAGKSWDVWLKTVAEAQANGKIAELYPEEID